MTAEWLRRGLTGENKAVDRTGWILPEGYRAPAPRPLALLDLAAALGGESRDTDARATEAPGSVSRWAAKAPLDPRAGVPPSVGAGIPGARRALSPQGSTGDLSAPS